MKNVFKEKAFVALLLTAIIAIAGVIGAMSLSGEDEIIDLNEPTRENDVAQQETTTEEKKVVSSVTMTENNEEETTETVRDVEAAVPVLHFSTDSTLLWPVNGEVILEYNMDNTIYFPTLNEYKCNPAVVLQADKDMDVVAATVGVVKETGYDEEIGNYVVMTIGDGYELTYGQLNELDLAVGQAVSEGEVIGTIAEPTKYYINEGYNLYLKLSDGEKTVDPLDYLSYN